MNRDDMSWEEKLATLGNEQDRALLKRLRLEDPDTADELQASLIEAHLDELGMQTVSSELNDKLYAIANNSPQTKPLTVKRPLRLWGSWVAVAATLVIAVMIKPWQLNQPSADEVALAREQLAITFFYLNKAADKTRVHTQETIAYSVEAAMAKAVFVPDEEDSKSL